MDLQVSHYFCVYPGKYENVTLELLDTAGRCLLASYSDVLDLARNSNTNLGLINLGSKEFGYCGYVRDNEGNAISGVKVTDGLSVVQTDSNGKFSIPMSSSSPEFIYITVPSGYEIPYDSNGTPCFWQKIDKTKFLYDFTLTPLSGGVQTQWTLCAIADPQVKNTTYKQYPRLTKQLLPVLKNRMAGYSNLYGMMLGDICWNSAVAQWTVMKSAMGYTNTGIHSFAIPGNHDLVSDKSSVAATDSYFKDTYGPTNYSFDRGQVHVIGINDVKSIYDSSEGWDGSSILNVTDNDYNWIAADLAKTPKTMAVVLCCHIPFTATSGNAQKVKELLAQYASAYILSAHIHVTNKYTYSVSSKNIYEFNCPALCGQLWYTRVAADGSPIGVTMFSFDGASLSDIKFENLVNDDSQMRCYDASISIKGDNLVNYGWEYDKGYIVANVYNATPFTDRQWTVELLQNGVKCCDMSRITSENTRSISSSNIKTFIDKTSISNAYDWWAYNQLFEKPNIDLKKDYMGVTYTPQLTRSSFLRSSSHLFVGKLSSVPSDMSKAVFEVRATDPYGNVYTCSTLTTFDGVDSEQFWDW